MAPGSAWNSTLAVLFLGCCVSALYEDQIKKFDWRSLHIGGLENAQLELNAFQPRLLVSTRENVIASICPKTGQLLWRQVLETGERGDIKLLHISSSSLTEATQTAAARMKYNQAFDLLSVQGHSPALIRGWNTNTGTIEFEWSLLPNQVEYAEGSFWFVKDIILYHVLPVWKSHLEVTQYYAASGQAFGTTGQIIAPWINAEQCVASGVYYTCLDGNQLISIDLIASQAQVKRTVLPKAPKDKIKPLKGANGILVIDNALVSVDDEVKTCSSLKSQSFLNGNFNQRQVIFQADIVDKSLHILAFYTDTCQQVEELTNIVPYPDHYGLPRLSTYDCKSKRGGYDGKGCLFLLDTRDDAILAVQQGKIRWARDEALANVVATEFIDLPLADSEGTLENEMKGKSGDIVNAFLRRISGQAQQIKSIFLHVIGLGPPPTDTQRAGLVRDAFGLHKMLVVLTKSGKIFGIDNISGKHHWQTYLADADQFSHDGDMRLIVQRTAKHFPLQPLCTVVARDKTTGQGIIFRFNPITGAPAEGGLIKLNYKIKQLALLAETDTDFVKGILLLDAADNVHVYPENSKKSAHGIYIYTADIATGTLNGYYVQLIEHKLSTLPVWNAHLGGHNNENQIIGIAAKNPIEHVHSQGRVLGDRSVLYKYINPNLVAVVTQANDAIHKYTLTIYLIDVVSGSVVFSMVHRKARGPLRIVHSENWLAYSYYNDKVRRTEITTMELYEGKTQANSTVWSSLNAPPMPLVERQSYIIPTLVETMRETITERGITNKHVLIGAASGGIIEMPWAFLDPRRPIASTTQGREEGAIPYIPELPLHTENFINYNQTVARLSNIFTAPSGLESTCLVVATGLDMFVTRVSPSKTFDLLKEDFDYILISAVLVALTSGSLITKYLAAKKTLKQAWK